MNNTWELDEAGADRLAEKMVGHKIVSFTEDTLTLDNGVEVFFEDNAECCAHFGYDMNILDTDHIITCVTATSLEHPDVKYDQWDGFLVTILAENKQVGFLDIFGSAGSGCYMDSIFVTVREKK